MTNTSSDGPWIPICCDPEKPYHPIEICYENNTFPGEELIFPNIYDFNLSISTMNPSELVPRFGIPCSKLNGYYLKPYQSEGVSFYLLENGTVHVNTSLTGTANEWLGIEDYCFIPYGTANMTESGVIVCSSQLTWSFFGTDALTLDAIFVILLGISIPLLALTFLVYTLLPELKNIPGLILRMYIACLLVVNVGILIVFADRTLICNYFLDITLQFAFLSCGFWMNVMAFDIWWTFRSMQDSSKLRSRRKFAKYSIYAWGLPALITSVGSIIDFIPALPTGVIKPGLRESCWFFSIDVATTIYFFGPVNCTVLSNVVFFTLTANMIFRHGKNAAHYFKGQNVEKQRFKLYLKLFGVMGIAEIANVIEYLWKDLSPYIRFIIGIPSNLQGLTVFIIFVCKKNIIQLLLKRLKCESLRLKKSANATYQHSPSNTSPTTSYPMTTPQRSTVTIRDDVGSEH